MQAAKDRVPPQVTHPQRIVFPKIQFTKAEIVAYYDSVAPFILPHLKNRPLTLKLYPRGAGGQHVYLKDAPPYTPAWVHRVAIERQDKSHGRPTIDFILVNDRRTLLWAANLSNFEMHTFLAKAAKIDEPSFVVFDLDPGPPATILDCCTIAIELKKRCDRLGLESFAKVSGSKGLHVYVPLNTKVTYEMTAAFAKAIAEQIANTQPELVVSEMSKSLRRGRVLIDWSQNVYYKSTVAPYSLRAKDDRPWISLPVEWREISRAIRSGDADGLFFSPEQALRRLRKIGDLFAPVLKLKQKLPGSAGGRRLQVKMARKRQRLSAVLADSNGTVVTQLRKRFARLSRARPQFVQPMQPELVSRLPETSDWQYEVKWDGYRAIAVKDSQKVYVYSRRRDDITSRYRAISRWMKELPASEAVLDGEILAVDSQGRPAFHALQNIASGKAQLVFMAFDLLNVESRSLLNESLATRQMMLKHLLASSKIQVSLPLDTSLKVALKAVTSLGLEGIVAKRRDSKYIPGARGGAWLKFRTGNAQEFVIGGIKQGQPFDSLLVGYYEEARLIYAGKVKAGLRPVIRRDLYQKIKPLIVDRCPFVNLPQTGSARWGDHLTTEKMRECLWVRPKLVAQIGFVEWTEHSNLRHPRFLGLRDDKRPRDVVRER